MSDIETTLPEAPQPRRTSRLRRFFLRHLPLSIGGLVLLLVLMVLGMYFWANSNAGEGFIRGQLVARVEAVTGGRVEIASFQWRLLTLEADAYGLAVHGLEAPGEAPYVAVDHLKARISLLGFFFPQVRLRDLEISHPAVHLIVYPDGSTNQPHPRKPVKRRKSGLDMLFDLEAGHVSVTEGVLDYENRAASFDFQNREAPLDFDGKEVSLRVDYVGAGGGNPESYHIEAGAADLNLERGGPRSKARPVEGAMRATVDLTRTAAFLRFLRITAHGFQGQDHTIEISGSVEDFAQPRWQAKTTGELDMKLLDPVFGYPFAPEGIARVELIGEGAGGEFRTDGSVHVDGGSYVGTGVVATGVVLDAHVHADPRQLLITSVVARLREGGQMQGEVNLHPWLPSNSPAISGAAQIQPASPPRGHGATSKKSAAPQPAPPTNPVNGKVTAELKGVALDTILEMVSQPPFQHLGLDARLNGTAVANWSNGDERTVVVDSNLGMSPSDREVPGEAPTSGAIGATYTQRDGAVDLRKLEVNTPASTLEAHGHLGAYPLTSSTAISVEFHSRNLGEFDTVLRSLGLHRNGKSGSSALPVSLAGQVDFLQGAWNGSLVSPRLSGNLKATQLAIEMPAAAHSPDGKSADAPGQTRMVQFDSVEATGSYSATRIEFTQGLLRRGNSRIEIRGTLDAAESGWPAYGGESVVHAHVEAGNVGVEDLQPFIRETVPVTGKLDAQIQLDGALNALGGAGWVELNGGSAFGEPVTRIRAQGSLNGSLLKLASGTVGEASGAVAAAGSYDLKSRQFQLEAKGKGIDVSQIKWLRRQNVDAAGSLAFSVSGSGTPEDPHLEGHAAMSGLTVDGEAIGAVALAAQTANRTVTYDATTRFEGTEVDLNGQTALHGDYATQAKLNFSQFNIGALLKLAHIDSLSGESALAGTVTVEGPLAHPEQLRGEARLQDLEVTVAGVALKSEGGLRAAMANGRVHLDPLHVTGENTDLHAQGDLALKGTQQLDFAASGSINLKLAETLDPDLTASGTTTFQVEAHGPVRNPGLQGRIDFQNASLSLEDIPNGLSQLHGTLEFNQNRLEVKSLTAMSGGGLLSVGGYLAYQHGIYADLSVSGQGIRIRYPQGVSSQADATLHLEGTRTSLLLSGNVMVTRFTLSPDLDITALAAQANSMQSITPPDAPSNHVRLDVHVLSSPQLNFQNAFAKLAGDVDLHLRGTLASPSMLGRISVTEGNAVIAGTRYELQRGELSFTNPVRIEPSIDLNATARVQDYDITLNLHGTPDKLAVTYRSDPPMPEADVVALLALGRTANQQRLYTQQQEQTGSNPTTDALLGGALNATVSSRVQKLFGAGSVKVDPNYLGALGNSTSRIIVEEQLGRDLTLTYATNVNTTGQQLLQAEVAINRHVSLLVARDESGVFSMVLKATRRYR